MDPSSDLLALLESKLDSFEKLELVLILHGARRPLTVADLAIELQVGTEALRRVVTEVVSTGVVDMTDGEAVSLRSGPWDPLVQEAADIHANEPARLMRACARISMAKLRSLSARTFADAFRFRKKGD